jgi:AmmeMemoRadiSam system protein A
MDKGELLTGLARTTIAARLDASRAKALPDAPFLHEKGACFVTLHKHAALRGCIGTLEAHRPLIEDVRANALAAAFRDPRFPPLSSEELAGIDIEVSLLTPSRPLIFASEKDALIQLRPGIDGVILEYGIHRGTFLPQVWEQLPDASLFMAHLKQKAGLPATFWDNGIRLSVYQVEKFSEARGEA